ncbi:hypothetical protein ACFL4O_03220 [bacterium]
MFIKKNITKIIFVTIFLGSLMFLFCNMAFAVPAPIQPDEI